MPPLYSTVMYVRHRLYSRCTGCHISYIHWHFNTCFMFFCVLYVSGNIWVRNVGLHWQRVHFWQPAKKARKLRISKGFIFSLKLNPLNWCLYRQLRRYCATTKISLVMLLVPQECNFVQTCAIMLNKCVFFSFQGPSKSQGFKAQSCFLLTVISETFHVCCFCFDLSVCKWLIGSVILRFTAPCCKYGYNSRNTQFAESNQSCRRYLLMEVMLTAFDQTRWRQWNVDNWNDQKIIE